MAGAHKFLFNTEFAANKPKTHGEAVWDVPPTEHDLTVAREDGYAAGFAAGHAKAEAESSRMEAQALERLAQGFVDFKGSYENAFRGYAHDATAIAIAVATKLASTLIAANPIVEIEAVITDILSRIMGEARVVVRVHDDMLDAVQARVDTLAKQIGFDGQVIILGEPGLAPSDCRIEWADGGVSRDCAALTDEIERSVRRLVDSGAIGGAGTLDQAPKAEQCQEPAAGVGTTTGPMT